MSTVLWANYLVNGQVLSEQADYPALYQNTEKLDAICTELQVITISDMLDHTDARINAMDEKIPEGMTSTDEVMAAKGHWIPANKAVDSLEQLKVYLIEHYPRIGLIHNATPDIITELEKVIDWALRDDSETASFNFSVVS